MPTELALYDETFIAGADLSAAQYKLVEISAANTVTVCNATTDLPVGILQNKPTAGQAAQVRLLGRSRCVSDGSGTAIVAGDQVGTDGSGRAVKKAANNDIIVGRAMEPSTAAGTIIDVLMTGPYYFGA